ncbi:MAG: chloride channel protein, partial [Chromatiales bacterium]
MKPSAVRERWQSHMESMRLRLARPDALLALAVLGLATGVLAGLVIVSFRLAVEGTQSSFLPGGLPEGYERLPLWARFLLPVAGGLVIGVVFHGFAKGVYTLGIARVMERLAFHQGYLTLRGFLLQFIGAAVAIVSGHSVGREGPHVFLGAAAASLLGQRLALPNNSIRTLVGCGTAAGIAASFNTPLAGVIFALEVVMMDYTLASFIPVILAAVSADTISILVFGADAAFRVPAVRLGTLAELPVVLLLGIAVGALAAAFVQLLKLTTVYSQRIPYVWRTSLA